MSCNLPPVLSALGSPTTVGPVMTAMLKPSIVVMTAMRVMIAMLVMTAMLKPSIVVMTAMLVMIAMLVMTAMLKPSIVVMTAMRVMIAMLVMTVMLKPSNDCHACNDCYTQVQ